MNVTAHTAYIPASPIIRCSHGPPSAHGAKPATLTIAKQTVPRTTETASVGIDAGLPDALTRSTILWGSSWNQPTLLERRRPPAGVESNVRALLAAVLLPALLPQEEPIPKPWDGFAPG